MRSLRKPYLLFIEITLFFVFFTWYLHSAFPSIYGGDTGELIVSAHILGIPHAPGYPLFTLLGKLSDTSIPWGNHAYRINLLSVCIGSVTLVLFFKLALNLTATIIPSLFATFFLGCVPIFFEQSIVSEVFMLNVCIAVAILLLASKHRSSYRHVYCAAFLFGLGLGNHHTLILLIPACHLLFDDRNRLVLGIIYCLACMLAFADPVIGIGAGAVGIALFYGIYPVEKHVIKAAGACFLWLAAGLTIYAYLPVRAAGNPAINFGDPHTVSNFIRVITRREFGSFTLHPTALQDRTGAALWGQVLGYVATLVKQLGFMGILLFFTGLIRVYRAKRLSIMMLACLVPGIIFILYSNLSPNTLALWRLERFHLLPITVMMICIAWGYASITGWICSKIHIPIWIQWCSACVILTACVYPLPRFNDARKHFYLRDFGRNLIRTVPPKSTVILDTTLFDEYGSSLAYTTLVEKKRPDLKLVARSGTMLGNVYGDDFQFMRGESRHTRMIDREKKLIRSTAAPVYYAAMDRSSLPPGMYRYHGLLHVRGNTGADTRPFYIRRDISGGPVPIADYPTRLILVHYPYFTGKYFLEEDKMDEAGIYLRVSAERGSDMEWLLYNIGSIYSRSGDLPVAESYYIRALMRDPFFPDTYFGLGYVFFQQKKFRSAETAFRKTIALDARFVDAYYNLGITQWQMGKKDSARETFKEFLKIKPRSAQADHIQELLSGG